MSLLRKDDVYEGRNENAVGKPLPVADGKPESGVILALVCAALAITLAAALWAPKATAPQTGSDVMYVGP